MSKNVILSEEAYAVLWEHKRNNESFSDVVKRFVPPPIRTFGDLEKHLEKLDGPLNVDFNSLERVRKRRKVTRRAGF